MGTIIGMKGRKKENRTARTIGKYKRIFNVAEAIDH